jgi:hypothetical protein
VIRVVVLFESEPEAERYRQHVEEFVHKVEYDAFRHGKSFGAPMGEPAFAYYAEFEWADRERFQAATRSQEFAATGQDAVEMGVPFSVTFAELG